MIYSVMLECTTEWVHEDDQPGRVLLSRRRDLHDHHGVVAVEVTKGFLESDDDGLRVIRIADQFLQSSPLRRAFPQFLHFKADVGQPVQGF